MSTNTNTNTNTNTKNTVNAIRFGLTATALWFGVLAHVQAATPMPQTTQSTTQEATLRTNLAKRLPNLPMIDEVKKMPMSGLFEVRLNGTDVIYTDAEGDFVIQGTVFDTKNRINLTEERVKKLNAIDFSSLPLKDAFLIVRGNGKRKMALFEDPNCGYCKQFERELQSINNVTVYLFLLPILSADSLAKSQNVWCSKDKAKVWQDFMVKDVPIPTVVNPKSLPLSCDESALNRNKAFAKKHNITGTPTLVFANGKRTSGAMPAGEVEQSLVDGK